MLELAEELKLIISKDSNLQLTEDYTLQCDEDNNAHV